jgi:serralysin
VTIENAVGGSVRDVLWGNEVANRLDGRGGDDVLQGFGGDDTLVGGGGADSFVIGAQTADGAADRSTDTVTDFETGVDTLDLSAFEGLTLAGVSFDDENGKLSIDLDGNNTTDLVVMIQGSFSTDDILFG